MVSVELYDDDCPEVIKNFIRKDKDIEVYSYVTRGCNGEVYFGKRPRLGDEVVLKFYDSIPAYDSSDEAVILRKIEHPNILQIHHLFTVSQLYACFITPKISGGDLQGIIDDAKPISTHQALVIISGILKGLNELHASHQLVHRDLKPGNILLDLNSFTPIIADLGSVKKINEADSHVTASKATRVYLPPETIVDDEYYFHSDLYQVGVIMYQLLGGYFPINRPMEWLTEREKNRLNKITNSITREIKLAEIIDEKIVKGKIADTSKLPLYLDSEFKRVLNKALHKDKSKRYQSPSEFLAAAHRLIRKYPVYTDLPDYLLISSGNKEYRIYYDDKNHVIFKKRVNGKNWRKDSSHKGEWEKALTIARKNK
jgi:serine/threonine protein kinase